MSHFIKQKIENFSNLHSLKMAMEQVASDPSFVQQNSHRLRISNIEDITEDTFPKSDAQWTAGLTPSGSTYRKP